MAKILPDKTLTKKNKGGRPKTTVKQRVEMITFDYDKIKKLAEFGFIDTQLAELFGVTEKTITNWKKQSPEFITALKKGKEIADARVVMSLLERATGYSHPDVHISNHQGVITETKITKHYAPDPTSMIFWLKNRQPANWRDRQEIDFTKPIEVVITDYRGKQD
jgi:hypothetical protein